MADLTNLKANIQPDNIPTHIAIIMDGNGRWAKKQGAKRIFGHQNAIQAVRDATEGSAEIGVKYLTLYAFSTENWNRPELEVNALMQLLVSTIKSETPTLEKNNIRLETIGDITLLPPSCQKELQEAKNATAGNTGMTLILALSYSSRWEITNAVKNMGIDILNGILQPANITENVINSYLCTANYPDPELLIRTSGEMRISNFLMWQIAYTELFFTETLWPDFRKKDLEEAIIAFQKRERRFGKTSEQLAK
jgi:undecaprenyl diphosphate synthase